MISEGGASGRATPITDALRSIDFHDDFVPAEVVRIGNGAIAGARLMLVSQTMRRTAEDVARRIEHVKPNEREPEFTFMVAEKMYF